ncbi:transposable element Tc1 transposase [Trichonephila clavipes]|nr:transposable element Tc1 transposase [Trichonephila clavipes]
MASERDNRHLLHMAVDDCTASFRQLAARWFTATGLRLQLAHERRAWTADSHQVVFSDESRFNLWDHDDRIRLRLYASERCLPKCVIEGHSPLTFRVTVGGEFVSLTIQFATNRGVRALVPQKFSVEEELMHVKHAEVKSPHVGVMWTFGRGVISSGIVLVT